MYAQHVPLVVSNATCHESFKWQHTGKGDKEKEDEQTSSAILECHLENVLPLNQCTNFCADNYDH